MGDIDISDFGKMIDFCYSRYNDKGKNKERLGAYQEYEVKRSKGRSIGDRFFEHELTFTSDKVDGFPAPILQSLIFMLISCKQGFKPDMYTMRRYDKKDLKDNIFALVGKSLVGKYKNKNLYTIAYDEGDKSIILKKKKIFSEIYCVIELPEALVIKTGLKFPQITHVSLSPDESPDEIRVETDEYSTDLPEYDDVHYPDAPRIKVKEQDRYLENDREKGTGAILYATEKRTRLAYELLWQTSEE